MTADVQETVRRILSIVRAGSTFQLQLRTGCSRVDSDEWYDLSVNILGREKRRHAHRETEFTLPGWGAVLSTVSRLRCQRLALARLKQRGRDPRGPANTHKHGHVAPVSRPAFSSLTLSDRTSFSVTWSCCFQTQVTVCTPLLIR